MLRVIKDIEEDCFTIDDVLIDDMPLARATIIKYDEVENGELNLTDNGWY